MSRRNVLLDVDGVLADFLEGVRRVVAEVTDQPVPLRRTIFTDDLEGDVAAHWLRRSAEPAFCAGLLPYEGAAEAVEELRRHADVVAVTKPLARCTAWESVRRAWLERHFGFHRRDVVFTDRKDLVFGHLLVDDDFGHVAAWISRWAETHPLVLGSPPRSYVVGAANMRPYPQLPLGVHWRREYNGHEQAAGIAALPEAACARVVDGSCWRRDVIARVA